MKTTVYRPSKIKLVGLIAISLGFVWMGTLLLEEAPLAAWGCIGFFGLCAAILGLSLHPNSSYLELSEQGFFIVGLFRRRFVRWDDVDGFTPIRIQMNRLVGWNYLPHAERGRGMRRFSSALAGVEFVLPDTYGMSPEALASLLNDRLTLARAEGTG